MCDIINRFSINCHSSIRCDNGNMVLRFDPFRVEEIGRASCRERV